MPVFCATVSQVGKQLFTVHKFILASASPLLASLLQPAHPPSPSPRLPPSIKSLSASKMTLAETDPSVFEAFLHYLYCSHVCVVPNATRPVPPTSDSVDVESTPDTSFASIDESDLSGLYDRYGLESPRGILDSSGGLGVCFSDSQGEGDAGHVPTPVTVGAARGQSTPKKRGHSRSRSPGRLLYSAVRLHGLFLWSQKFAALLGGTHDVYMCHWLVKCVSELQNIL